MKKIVLILIATLMSNVLWAQTPTGIFFDGTWQGEVKLTSDEDPNYKCFSTVYLTIDFNEVALRQELRGNCYYNTYILFETDGETLFQFGNPVGKISEQKIQFKNVYEQINGDLYSATINLLSEQQIKMSDSTEYSTGLVSTTEGFLYKDEKTNLE